MVRSILFLSILCASTALARLPLFDHIPELEKNVAYVSLAQLPTPTKQLSHLGEQHGMPQLYMKDDGQTSSDFFGGNKVRKLEFLLADAQKLGMQTVLTFGCVGSNHATATASHAQRLGLNCIVMLKPQPNSSVVRKNLLLMHNYDAEMHYSSNNATRALDTISVCLQHKEERGDFPYLIPTGGSCPIGILGYVNAALELKQQIEDGLLPEPDYLYVAAGSFGTVAGLLLGAKIAGLNTEIIPANVWPEKDLGKLKQPILRLFHATNKLMHNHNDMVPLFSLTEDDIRFVHACCGDGYGMFTPEGMTSINEMQQHESVMLDGTYSGKALAGLLYDVQENQLNDKVILFWNTFCGNTFDEITSVTDYKELPEELHIYFEEDVQEIDRQ